VKKTKRAHGMNPLVPLFVIISTGEKLDQQGEEQMLTIKAILFLSGLAIWLYFNFVIVGLGREYVPPIYVFAFLVQLLMLFIGYMWGLSTGREDGNKEGWQACLAEIKNVPRS
jgi:hypothetical protein